MKTKLAVGFLFAAGVGFVGGLYAFTPLDSWYQGEEITFERAEPEPTEFEKYIASEEVQAELDLMFKRHKRDALNAEITELESKR